MKAFFHRCQGQVDLRRKNGEFSFVVFDGPGFSAPVEFSLGETVLRESFWFCDLLPE